LYRAQPGRPSSYPAWSEYPEMPTSNPNPTSPTSPILLRTLPASPADLPSFSATSSLIKASSSEATDAWVRAFRHRFLFRLGQRRRRRTRGLLCTRYVTCRSQEQTRYLRAAFH
jgi:hypothetical protein